MTGETKIKYSAYKFSLPVVVFLVILIVVMILIPGEKTLGPAVKYVYLHVAFSFTGMLGFGLMALSGIILLIFSKESLVNLMISLGLVSTGAYIAGVLISMISASIAWGSVSFSEPYMIMSVQVILAALVIQISYFIVPWLKLKAVMSTIPVIFLLWLTNTSRLVLHPSSPIRDSSSGIIKLSFAAVFLPCLLFSGYCVYHLFRFYQINRADSNNSRTEP
jgi:hypothetical protein